MTPRVLLASGLAALALALLVSLRGGPAPQPVRTLAPIHANTPPPAPPTVASPRSHAPAPVAPVDAPALAPDEPGLPPPTSEELLPRPERDALTPAELQAQRLASLDLIARSIERLERERADAARAGDDETARLHHHRIERLRRRGEQIEQELAHPAADAEASP